MKRLLVSLCLAFLLGSVNAQDFKIADGVISYQCLFEHAMKPSVNCFRIPSIVTAPNGDLVAAIDERVPDHGDLRTNRNCNIVIRRSSDNGKTWTPIQTVVDFPEGRSASDPSMIVDKVTSEIFLFYNYMDLDKEPNIYYLQYVKSSDNGVTWTTPTDITSQISKPEWHKDFKFISSGRGVQTNDGKLLHTLVNLNHGLHVFGSDNHGKTWYLIDTPLKIGDESKIIELSDGRWMINSRVNNKYYRYVHISSDHGKTWTTTPDETLVDSRCNASIVRYTSTSEGYNKNRLLFSNAANAGNRTTLTVKISYDDGKTWSKGKVIYAGPAAYSDMTITKDGNIAVFFEKDEYTKNEFVLFSLKWLTDGQDKFKKAKRVK